MQEKLGMKEKTISRRDVLKGVALLGSLALGNDIYWTARAQAATSATSAGNRPWYELGMMADPVLDNQLLFYLSQSYQGFTDVGEVLDTASRIDVNDEYSWPNEWLETARRIESYAKQSLERGHPVSAGEAYVRASSYYRAALIHHPEPTDPIVKEAAQASMDDFAKALELLKFAQPVKIPYEGTTLPGYFYRSSLADDKAPLLIVFQGRDAWAEETKYLADAAIKRGYHCLQFQGPGQGAALRLQGLTFRHDWENVVTPVVDFALQQEGVDPERIILMGISFGGALAPRAAAFEKRIKICVANPGVLNWGAAIYRELNELAPDLMSIYEESASAFDTAVTEVMKDVPLLRWGFKDMMWKHSASSPSDLLVKLSDFNNEGIVEQITCQTLVMDGEAEAFSTGEGKRLFDALKSPKDYMLFTAEDTGLVHVQTAAMAVSSQRLFDYLDEAL
jgi:pimeloyl-ACP methyl ester carboxylesterase